MKYKIINKDKAKVLQIEELPLGMISIDMNSIPPGMNIEEYIEFIEKEGIILKMQ